MTNSCHYCRGPIGASPCRGRPFPDQAPAAYCCFGCLSLGESDRAADARPRPKLDGFVIRLGIGLLVAGQSMIFGLAINLEDTTPAAQRWGVQGAILAGTLLVLLLLGPALIRNAITEIRRGRLTIEALFLLTMFGALAASLQSFISGHGPIYFEVVSVLLVVYSLGKAIGAHTRASAVAAATRWAGTLGQARLVDAGGRERMLDVGLVMPGDLIEARSGEAIAIDGVIRSGIGFISESAVNGEPFAVVRRPGDTVLAGMISFDATFRIEATASGTERQIDRLLEAVEQARQQPLSIQAQADRLGRVFLPLVMLAAIGTFAFWTLREDWSSGLFKAMSVLLVACPCALGLATPIVLWSALNRLAERGMIVHSGDMLERLAAVDRVYCDKTGTLTDDQFALVDLVTVGNRAHVQTLLALVEQQSRHPIARPFAALPRALAAEGYPRVLSFTAVPGCGVEANVEVDSGRVQQVRIGRPDWLNAAEANHLLKDAHAPTDHRVDCTINGKLAAVAFVRERLRDSTREALDQFQALGLPVRVLTGDTAERAMALSLPDTQGGMLPDDKRRVIVESGGKALMIGDGINDASALAAAHVGIALSSGTDLANSTATATLYHDDLRVVPWSIAVAREAMQAVRRNLLRAAVYNGIGIALAMAGILHPVVAALLMVGSSLLVAWSSVRVGISADPCACPGVAIACEPSGTDRRRLIHAMAFALQGIVFAQLLGLSGEAVVVMVVAFGAIGFVTAWYWQRRADLTHGLDMAYGMLTLGNLGMLVGWWADNGFAPLHDAGCCRCVEAMREGLLQPWMWVGMLVGANVAMRWLMRRPHPGSLAMYTGGNAGMVAGMLAGGAAAGWVETSSVTGGVMLAFAGMTAGMLAGMFAGTWLMTRLMCRTKVNQSSEAATRSEAVV